MSPKEFEETLIRYKHRKPFEPFEIELNNGQVLLMDGQGLAFNETSGAYWAPTYDLHMFECGDVKAIRLAVTPEVKS